MPLILMLFLVHPAKASDNNLAISYTGEINSVKDDGYTEKNISSKDTVRVSNADDFLEAVFNSDDGKVNAKSNYSNKGKSHIQKIVLDNDIDLNQASKKYRRYYGTSGSRTTDTRLLHSGSSYENENYLVINGQGHTLHMANNTMSINTKEVQTTWTLENMRVLTTSYYGPIRAKQGYTSIRYRNIDFFGAQLLWTDNVPECNAEFYGTVSVRSLSYYNARNNNGKIMRFPCDGKGQQNMQTGNAIFNKNCRYYGEAVHGNCLELYGSTYVESGAQIELHPHGTSVENNQRDSAVGIFLRRSSNYPNGSSINLQDNSNVNVVLDTRPVTDNEGNRVDFVRDVDNSQASMGVYIETASKINVKGSNANFNVNGYGNIYKHNPLVYFNRSMDANITGKNAGFNIYEHNPEDYSPRDGILFIDGGSDIVVNKNANFSLQTDYMSDGDNTYLLSSQNNAIQLNSPNRVLLDNHGTSGNSIVKMNNDTGKNHYIDSKNIEMSASGTDLFGNAMSFKNAFLNRLYLPITDNKIYTLGTKVLGDYNSLATLASNLHSMMTSSYLAKEFDRIEFRGIKDPRIVSIDKTSVNPGKDTFSGRVVDSDGYPLKDTYIRLFFEDNKNRTPGSKYVTPDYVSDIKSISQVTPDLANNILSSSLFLFSMSHSGITGSNISFGNLVDGSGISSNPLIANYLDAVFNEKGASKNIYGSFNSNASVAEAVPYTTFTDANGNFTFKAPKSIWQNMSQKKILSTTLYIEPSYYFNVGPMIPIIASLKPELSLSNSIKNLSYEKSNVSSDGSILENVYQGDAYKDGDELQFNINIKNSSEILAKNYTYVQPVPNSINDDSLQISYDGGKSYSKLNSNDYFVNGKNNGYKNINVKSIDILPNSYNNISIKGTLKYHNSQSNDKVDFKPLIFDNSDDVAATGTTNKIFYALNDFNFYAKDISYGNISAIDTNKLIFPTDVNSNEPNIVIEDNRRVKSRIGIFAHQDNDNFTNSDNSQKFVGKLIYKNQKNYSDLSESEVEIINSNNPYNISWNKDKALVLMIPSKPSAPGDYKTGITWTVKNGF